ncbi:hypothetical protein BDA99DRAFT_556415 [Phascolomyces articulosus]|uniref:Uncharacterized protein n=1 Tax=Phascolomyces articulosus TaxID=60185 RepID=A0AAD5KJE3_9FUNG|nr:hypothetical protein BDA99DRAFT_556415 [Phascolomyces articulosus]
MADKPTPPSGAGQQPKEQQQHGRQEQRVPSLNMDAAMGPPSEHLNNENQLFYQRCQQLYNNTSSNQQTLREHINTTVPIRLAMLAHLFQGIDSMGHQQQQSGQQERQQR